MSMRRLAQVAWRFSFEIAQRARLLPRTVQPVGYVGTLVQTVAEPPLMSKNRAHRLIQMLLRHQRIITRPFVTLAQYRHRFTGTSRFQNFNRFRYKSFIKKVGVVERVRDVFGTNERYNPALRKEEFPEKLDAYEIGDFIAQGGNGAVYALRLKEPSALLRNATLRLDPGLAALPSTSQERGIARKRFPLALKLMFNYEHERRGDDHLWANMGAELVPLPPGALPKLRGRFRRFHPLPASHPNIVKMHTAFVDAMPILPDALARYPEAVPPIDIDPRTMFVVMKRYRMDLHEYMNIPGPLDTHKGTVMLAQLLEGVHFLHQSRVSQRDMKSDNILLEFDDYDEVPFLVISDFGCALAQDDWNVAYRSDEVDLGGNAATRAPEVIGAKPGPGAAVNFAAADLWASGGLAYEIYTRSNPFYSRLRSSTYREKELPVLPEAVPAAISSVIRAMLRRDPEHRVQPVVAADVVGMSLFRYGADVHGLVQKGLLGLQLDLVDNPVSKALKKLGERMERALDDVLMLATAETIFARFRADLSQAEAQVRATFLSRVERSDLRAALGYFMPPPQPFFPSTVPGQNPEARPQIAVN
ncbi:unnamed protein product, partial [Mesorhabditis spiculigera]